MSAWWFEPGRMLDGRYRLDEVIGRGANGEVWRALDVVMGECVAVKVLAADEAEGRVRARREAATLRLLRVPNVVRLRDEGVAAGRTFLVMDLVDGAPFPARPPPCAWSELAPLGRAFLEALDRIHAAGIVHGDLKPANVLVAKVDRPMLVDFGISLRAGPRGADANGEAMVGTPMYMAPEQIRGEPLSRATDLYAAGVMLYEALSGAPPHGANNPRMALVERLRLPPSPLATVAPHVPSDVAAAIDWMLAFLGRDRPASAGEALRRMGGREAVDDEPPWLGSTHPLADTCAHLSAGRSVDVVGPSGAGRTRFLEEAVRWLRSKGHPVYRWMGDDTSFDGAGGAPARRTHGAIVFADDIEDTHAGQLSRLRDRMPVLCAYRDPDFPRAPNRVVTVRLEPLPTKAYETWFSGLDRLFHVREDAACLLSKRSGGWPGRARVELAAWVRAGVVHEDGDRWRVDPEGIDVLRCGTWFADEPLFRLLSSHNASAVELAAAAAALARRELEAGSIGRAVLVLEDGVRAARQSGDAVRLDELFALWLQAISADRTPSAADRLLYELGRTTTRSADLDRIEALARASLAANADPPRALEALEALTTTSEMGVETCRAGLRMVAARSVSAEREEQTLADIARWASASGDADVVARLDGWRGRVAYRHGRFDAAADLHLRAAAGLARPLDGIAARINAASALLEAFRHDEALAWGERSLQELRRYRDPLLAARAEWIIRAAMYRLERHMTPDIELVEEVAAVGVRHMEALVAFTEATVAFRVEDWNVGRELALQAESVWRTIRTLPELAALARCVAAACGEPLSAAAAAALVAQATPEAAPGTGIQIVGMVAHVRPELRLRGPDDVDVLCQSVPREHWARRMEVIAVDEARRYLGVQDAVGHEPAPTST